MRFSTVAAALLVPAALTDATTSTSGAEAARIAIHKRTSDLRLTDSSRVDFRKVTHHLEQLRSKYQRNLDNYKLNTGEEHPLRVELAFSLEVRKTGTVQLKDVSDSLWVGPIAFGTPPQTILIDFDTGSADTLVNPGAYSPNKSSTSVKTTQRFSVAYGDGTRAKGTVYTDALTIGGLKAPKAAIGVSNSQFLHPSREGGNQGVSGMAFPSLARFGRNYPPFIDSLNNAGALSHFEFAFKLDATASSLTIGGYHKSDIVGEPTWVSLNASSGFWQVPAVANRYGPIESIVDTGTTAIVAPVEQAADYFKALGVSARRYGPMVVNVYPCSKPPPVSFMFGGKTIVLDKQTISIGTDDDGKCVLSVIGQDTGIRAWIAGDALLRNTVAIFDRVNARIGFGTPTAGPQ